MTTRGYGSALGALVHLGLNQKNNAKLREFLVGHVNSPKRRVALGAIDALDAVPDGVKLIRMEEL